MVELITVLISNQFTNLVLISTQLEKGPRFTLLTPKLSYSLGMRLNNIQLFLLQQILFLFNISLFLLLTLAIPLLIPDFLLFPSLSSLSYCFPQPLFTSLHFPPLSFLPPPTATSQGPVPSQTPALKRASARQHRSPQPRTHWRDFHRSRQPWRPHCITTAHPNKDRICPRGRGLQRWEWINSTNFGRPQRAQGRCVHTTTVFN